MRRSNAHSREGWWTEFHLPLLLVILLAMSLQLYGLDSKSLWFDELGTLTVAGWQGGWLDAIRKPLTMPTTPKPPLSFVITHLFLEVDDSVFALRLPSVLFATLAIPLIYALGKALFDHQVGLLSAFLLAIAPLHIRYAQEARMYAMLAFLSLLSLYLFWRAVRSTKGYWWFRFVIVVALSLYVHLFAFLSLMVLTLFGLWLTMRARMGRELTFRPWHFVIALASILLLYVPLAPFLVEGLAGEEGLGGSPAPSWNLAHVLDGLGLFSGGNNLGLAVYVLFFGLAGVVLAVKRREVLLLVAMWITLPVVVVMLTPFGHAVRIRYFIYVLPVYLLLVAYGLRVAICWLASRFARLPPLDIRSTAWITGVLLVILAGISVPSIASYYAETKQNWRDATWLAQTLAEPGDTIYVTHVYHRAGVLFYAAQATAGPVSLTDDSVRLLPEDPVKAFPLSDDRGYWLIVPFRTKFLPGGDLEARIEPHHRLMPPIVLAPSNVPEEGELIAPTAFRRLAIVQVTAPNPPTISFWADDTVIAGGDCTQLRWEVENVQEVYLDGEGVIGHGERKVCPAATTTHELRVVHRDGTISVSEVEITVRSP